MSRIPSSKGENGVAFFKRCVGKINGTGLIEAVIYSFLVGRFFINPYLSGLIENFIFTRAHLIVVHGRVLVPEYHA